MALRWYDIRGKAGSITIKARSEMEARQEAAERWGCGTEETVCVSHQAFSKRFVPAPEYSRD